MNVTRLSFLVLVLAWLAAACGGGSSPALLSSANVSLLRGDVQSIRSNTAAGRDRSARQAATTLAAHLQHLMAAGQLARADGQRLLVAVQQAERHIPVARAVGPAPAGTSTSPTVITSSATQPAPSAPAPAHAAPARGGKGPQPRPAKGKGHGEGHGGD